MKFSNRDVKRIIVFLNMAKELSRLSKDTQTQHGCLITDDTWTLKSGGYNSFARCLEDRFLPTTRPDKYPWMLHSEDNALSFCEHRPVGCYAFITGKPCFQCVQRLWQNGIVKVFCAHHETSRWNYEAEQANFNKFLDMLKDQMEVFKVDYQGEYVRVELTSSISQTELYEIKKVNQ